MDLPVINSKSKTSVSEVIFNQSVNKELLSLLDQKALNQKKLTKKCTNPQ
jgi:hypothetical protein